jgi:3-hydroxyisobutyrate dehydrogenase-like beta-hydroxyacid dehydrogenase
MVGGDAKDFEAAKPILQAMGKNIVIAAAPATARWPRSATT